MMLNNYWSFNTDPSLKTLVHIKKLLGETDVSGGYFYALELKVIFLVFFHVYHNEHVSFLY